MDKEKKQLIGTIFSIAATVGLLGLAWWLFLKDAKWKQLTACPVSELVFLVLLLFLLFAVNGLPFFYLGKTTGFNMAKKDILLFPLCIETWGILIPFQGSLAYQLWYLKRRYGITLSSNLSITLFLYLVTVTASGICGLVFIALHGDKVKPLFPVISIVCTLAPLELWIAEKILRRCTGMLPSVLKKGADWFLLTLTKLEELFTHPGTLAVYLLFYIMRMAVKMVIFWRISVILGYPEFGFLQLLIFNLWNSLALIIKCTPQNLGIAQIVTGTLFLLIGLNEAHAAQLSLFYGLFSTVVELIFGVPAHFYLRSCCPKTQGQCPP